MKGLSRSGILWTFDARGDIGGFNHSLNYLLLHGRIVVVDASACFV